MAVKVSVILADLSNLMVCMTGSKILFLKRENSIWVLLKIIIFEVATIITKLPNTMRKVFLKIQFVIFISCFSLASNSQNILFDSSGLLLNSQYDIAKKDTEKKILGLIKWKKKSHYRNFPTREIKDFVEIDVALKKSDRDILIEKLDGTINLLDPDNTDKSGLQIFLENIWASELQTYRNDLINTRAYLSGNGESAPLALTVINNINEPIKNNLFSGSKSIFKIKDPYLKDAHHVIELWRRFPLNQFTIDYYNSVSMPPIIRDFSMSTLLRYNSFVYSQYPLSDSLIKNLIASKKEISLRQLKEINEFNSILANTVEYTELIALLKNPWFKHWFWFRGGQLRLNPLNFTTESFYKKYPEFDATKASIFNKYIDQVLERYILYDSLGKVEELKKILALKDAGKDIYSLSDKIKTITETNKLAQANLQQTERLVNKVVIPEKEVHYSFTAIGDFKSANNNRSYLGKLLTEEESKTIILHNIPADRKGGTTVKTIVSPDISEVQKITDTVAGIAVQLGLLAGQFSPYAGVLNFFSNTKNTGGVKIVSATSTQERLAGRSPLMLDCLKESIKEYDNDSIFRVVVNEMEIDAATPYYESNPAHKAKAQEFLDKYTQIAAKKLYDKLRMDSLNLAVLYDFIANSTLPPTKLNAKENKQPLYYSAILTTPPSTDAQKEEITVFTSKSEKDTTKITTFSYERGKHHRFQLSAGISYTFGDVTQSSAREENGRIIISNSFQQYRFTVGAHVHWGKGLVLKDNRFPGNFVERSSVYVGIGIPKPLENIYLGYSYDFLPGLKTIVGIHLYKHNKYEIQNNTIISERLRYNVTFPFLAIHLDPVGVLKTLNVFKSN